MNVFVLNLFSYTVLPWLSRIITLMRKLKSVVKFNTSLPGLGNRLKVNAASLFIPVSSFNPKLSQTANSNGHSGGLSDFLIANLQATTSS